MYPFLPDAIANMRMDWCRNGSVHEKEGLSCILRSFMCNNHIIRSGDQNWISNTRPYMDQLTSSAGVSNEGVQGVCGLLSATKNHSEMWKSHGHNREKTLMSKVISNRF